MKDINKKTIKFVLLHLLEFAGFACFLIAGYIVGYFLGINSDVYGSVFTKYNYFFTHMKFDPQMFIYFVEIGGSLLGLLLIKLYRKYGYVHNKEVRQYVKETTKKWDEEYKKAHPESVMNDEDLKL